MATDQEQFDYLQRRLALDEADAAQKKKADDASSGPMGILSSVLGMGSAIGGMIPSLVKGGRQKRELQKFQRGQGAGASLARQTASEAARRVVGASTATPRGGRGGNLTEGLRAAEGIVQRGAQQAAVTGSKEALDATQLLRSNDLLRQNAFKTLGAGVGQGLAGIGGMLAASQDQGTQGDGTPVSADQEALLQAQGVVTQTPQEIEQAKQQSDVSATIRGGQEGLQRLKGLQGQGPPAPGGTDRFTTPGGFTQGMQAAREQGAASFQKPDQEAVRAQQVANQQAVNAQELTRATADKERSADLYRRSSNSNQEKSAIGMIPPAFNPDNPQELENWLYNAAFNYNPSMGLGMSPKEVALILMRKGLEPDWERLGVEPMSIGDGSI